MGGISQIHSVDWSHGIARVNRDKWVVPLTKVAGFGAVAFEQGDITDYLALGKLPDEEGVRDDFGFASAAMRFDCTVAAGSRHDVFVAVPFGQKRKLYSKQLHYLAGMDGATQFEEAVRVMRDRLGAVTFRMPPGVAREAAQTFRTAAGQILINRDGPAIQPGPRRYTRSWIRDGAIMGAALLRIGDQRALPEFIRWFAPYQRKDGFVPCCVDRGGPDWLVEHDSHGQLIYGVMESFRFTGDRDFLQEMWPFVRQGGSFHRRNFAHSGLRRNTNRRNKRIVTGCCRSRRAMKAIWRIRCTRIGMTSGRCADSGMPRPSPLNWGTPGTQPTSPRWPIRSAKTSAPPSAR